VSRILAEYAEVASAEKNKVRHGKYFYARIGKKRAI
jgi:hypothetical protein